MNLVDLQSHIFSRIAELSGVPAETVVAESTIDGLGLDSSDAVILAMEVEEFLGQEVDVGVFLRFETIGESVSELFRTTSSSDGS